MAQGKKAQLKAKIEKLKKKSTGKTAAGQKKSSIKSKTQTKKNTGKIQLGDQVWPIERDVFFRPGRLKYVRKIIQTEGCVFCDTANSASCSVETLCVYKTNCSQVVINKFPYNSGHLLILPLRHVGNMAELSDKEYLDLSMTVKTAIQAMTEVYAPHGFNLGMNHGATAGAGIPGHLHYHIVPRWNGDLNFFPLIAETKLVVEDVTETYQRYLTYFGKI